MNSHTRRARVCALTLSLIAVIAAFAAQPSLAAGGKDPKLKGVGQTAGRSDHVATPDGRFVFVNRSNRKIVTKGRPKGARRF